MDAGTLREAMGRTLSLARYTELLPAFERFLVAADCTTPRRAAMAIAQTGHESLGLRYGRELWGPTEQQRKYDPASGSSLARTLGNTQPGDGKRFAGAGWLQVTGRANFTAVSKWAHARGYVPTPTYFVDHPDELGSDRYVWIGPAWYWTTARPQLNARADAGDVEGATRLVNGGTYGLADRRARYEAALRLGDRLLPAAGTAPEGDDMPTADEIARAVWSAPIEDLYTPQGGDTMPAFAALGWAAAHGAFARQGAQAALSEVIGLRVAVEKLSGALVTGHGIDPAELEQAVRDGVARALAESVRVQGDLHLAPAAGPTA